MSGNTRLVPMSATAREERPSALETSQHPDLDDNVLAELPVGSSVLSVSPSGASAWVHTVRIDCRMENAEVSFFRPFAFDTIGVAGLCWLLLQSLIGSALLQYLHGLCTISIPLSFDL